MGRRGADGRHPQIRRSLLVVLDQALAQIVAHRHEHREARLGRRARLTVQQTAIDEGRERRERIELQRSQRAAVSALGGLDSLHLEAVHEGRQAP